MSQSISGHLATFRGQCIRTVDLRAFARRLLFAVSQVSYFPFHRFTAADERLRRYVRAPPLHRLIPIAGNIWTTSENVATSVSEWTDLHSLTLVATKKSESRERLVLPPIRGEGDDAADAGAPGTAGVAAGRSTAPDAASPRRFPRPRAAPIPDGDLRVLVWVEMIGEYQ